MSWLLFMPNYRNFFQKLIFKNIELPYNLMDIYKRLLSDLIHIPSRSFLPGVSFKIDFNLLDLPGLFFSIDLKSVWQKINFSKRFSWGWGKSDSSFHHQFDCFKFIRIYKKKLRKNQILISSLVISKLI